MPITPEDLVRREVYYCVSSLVSTLAGDYGGVDSHSDGSGEMVALTEQAMELAAPIDDWEEAATQAGWSLESAAPTEWRNADHDGWTFASAQAACEHFDIDPYEREVYEHWIVSDWLADKLAAKGEKVDKDFAGMTVWARTTTGQAIYADSVIEAITSDLNIG